MDRLIYEDTDKRVYVIEEATEDTPQVERYEWVNPAHPEVRLADVEARMDRIAAQAVTNTDAAKLRDAAKPTS